MPRPNLSVRLDDVATCVAQLANRLLEYLEIKGEAPKEVLEELNHIIDMCYASVSPQMREAIDKAAQQQEEGG